ncbi:activator of 90 kDa heat shock protein ATPase homolog 1 isoform X1 [Hydra vulgaris]|uniref:Activator of 90 kDa heat shock protein ATPase homolog 1 n=1 Tax=Hydra vulgaris TaxID=6087 RepID=T2MI75_HYDVU|nr:activator of 90 kDa heat shock protein ATPase homolog 1 [Hydra vulgaris]
MALWGQGDPRWIVEERPDSTNVNNWHWTERDATSWSKIKLKNLFSGLAAETDEGSWKVDSTKSIEGEATINNRKGKLIYFYEWVIKLEYKGKVSGSDTNHTGTIEIPHLSDENDPSEVDVNVSATGDSKNSEKLKQIVRTTGIDLVRKLCSQYVSDMKTEYSTGMVLPTKDGVSSHVPSEKPAIKVSECMKGLNVKESLTKNVSHHVALNLQEEFQTTAEELYITLTDSQRISTFTRSPCTSNPVTGGEFSIMGGNITGTYETLVPHTKIVQKWRFKEWPQGLNSNVVIELEQKSDSTLLKLKQTGVPDYDIVRTEEGWKRHFWGPIKQVFGFGAQLF